jgi:hypothetical protein
VTLHASVGPGPRHSFEFLTRWRALIYVLLLLLAVALIQFTPGRIGGTETSRPDSPLSR